MSEYSSAHPEEVAGFGQARVMKNFEGVVEVIGGTKEDREAAYAWLKQFWPHDRVIWPE